MPDPVTYDQAQALAQRLMDAQQHGATLLLGWALVIECFEWQRSTHKNHVTFRVAEKGRSQFTSAWEWFFLEGYEPLCLMTPAEFESYWQGRITVLRPVPWPTGKAVTWEQFYALGLEVYRAIEGAVDTLASNGADPGPVELRRAYESAERLADVCRTLARETEHGA